MSIEHDEDEIDGSSKKKKRIIYKFDRWRRVIVMVARLFGGIISVFVFLFFARVWLCAPCIKLNFAFQSFYLFDAVAVPLRN